MSYLLWFSLLFIFNVAAALAQPWEVAGQVVLTFADGQSGSRINELNDRLRQIVPNLGLNESWNVSPRGVFVNVTEKNSKDPKAKPKTSKRLQSIELLLNNNLLLTVTETDVMAQGASSLEGLANEWTHNLNQFLRQPQTKRHLYLLHAVPQQLSYGGKIYRLSTDVIPDRGLFRTNGLQLEGRVIFWEVPANDRTYLLDSKTKEDIAKVAQNADRIFIFDPKVQFVAYLRTGS